MAEKPRRKPPPPVHEVFRCERIILTCDELETGECDWEIALNLLLSNSDLPNVLNDWEREFIRSLDKWRGKKLSPKQELSLNIALRKLEQYARSVSG